MLEHGALQAECKLPGPKLILQFLKILHDQTMPSEIQLPGPLEIGEKQQMEKKRLIILKVCVNNGTKNLFVLEPIAL